MKNEVRRVWEKKKRANKEQGGGSPNIPELAAAVRREDVEFRSSVGRAGEAVTAHPPPAPEPKQEHPPEWPVLEQRPEHLCIQGTRREALVSFFQVRSG